MRTSVARKLGCFALLACGVALLTGCMTSPTNNTHLHYYYWQPIAGSGYVDKPNTVVVVEAFDWSRGTWVTFATGRSVSTPFHWDGRNWYYWQSNSNRLEGSMWSAYDGEARARLRAVSSGSSLFTFDEWNWTFDSTLAEVAEGVNGQEVTIHAWIE